MPNLNNRFDRLTNLDIATFYTDHEYWFFKADFLAALGYWIIQQSPYDKPNITNAIDAFDKYIDHKFKPGEPVQFTYEELQRIFNRKIFETIPEIEKFNHPKIDTGAKYLFTDRYSTIKPDYDFIDLGALAHNIFYMLLREQITQSYP